MSEIKVFRITNHTAIEVPGQSVAVEKSLQSLLEHNLETMLGVRFLQSEFTTSKSHSGRIDTLGIDENGCPVIIEYKRAVNENVINQGLFYLDWLLDHKADFKLLVLETCDAATASEIDWAAPRLICIAADFTKYDEHAVKQINRNIDLMRYRRFGPDLLTLELVHRTNATDSRADETHESAAKSLKRTTDKPVSQSLAEMDEPTRDLYEAVRSFILALGDDIQERQLKLYVAFRRIKNFASIVVQKKSFVVYLKLDPKTVILEPGFSRDVSNIGHWATGDLEITVRTQSDLLKAQPLVVRAYAEA